MEFKAYKEQFVDDLGLEMAYHKRIVNFCLQTMEDITLFVTECLSKFQNIVQAIMKMKKLKQGQMAEEGFGSHVVFVLSVGREGKAAYEKLLCEEITDHDYKNLKTHKERDVHSYWCENKKSSAMSIHKALSSTVKDITLDNNESNAFAGLL